MTTTIKPILKYPGAKNALAPWIIQYLPRTAHYVEPYAGSLGVFLAKAKAPHEVVNDLSGDVVNLFRVIREHGQELAALVEMTPYSRAEYYESYKPADEPLERARRFLVRAWQAHGYKAYCRTGWRHNGSQSLQSVTNLWNGVPETIRAVAIRLKDAEIECQSALAIIERYKTADTTIYADPPYPLSTRKGRKLYAHEMTDDDHLLLLDALDRHPGPVVLSGYACELYDTRLAHWHRVTKQTHAEKGQTRTEVLWLNERAAAAQQLRFL